MIFANKNLSLNRDTNNMNDFDLIPDHNQLQLLFVMESPHVQEMETGLPCMGTTGKRMALALTGNETIPFGKLLSDKDTGLGQYGIMNSFPFPLGLEDQLNGAQKNVARLKTEIPPWIKGETSREYYYDLHLNIIRSIHNLEEVSQFKARLTDCISHSPNLVTIVVCGYIAQSVFLHAFDQKMLPYNRYETRQIVNGRSMEFLFVNHPGNKDEKWDFKLKK